MKTATTQFIILACVLGIVTVLTFMTRWFSYYHWSESDDVAALPRLTFWAFKYGFIVPAICCLASVVYAVLSFKQINNDKMWMIYTTIVAVALIGQAIISFLYMYPVVIADYTLG